MSKFKRNPLLERLPQLFTCMWPDTSGFGRFWKRRLAKARRRVAKEEIREALGETDRIRQRGLPGIEGEVNYRTW